MQTGYLGPKGTYSEIAHDRMFSGTKKVEFKSFYEIFKEISDESINAAVIPIENALQGSVVQCLDLLYSYDDLYLTKEAQIAIEHRLIVKDGVKLSDIKVIYSHEQAIKQCAKFLSENLPNTKIIYTDSTAASVQNIKDNFSAGIVGAHFKKAGLKLLDYNISEAQNNVTRFCKLEKGLDKLSQNCNKIFIAVGGKNKPGALLEILSILSKDRLNMTKIESRPLKTKIGEYVFFIEFEGSLSDKKVTIALEKLKRYATGLKLLGCY